MPFAPSGRPIRSIVRTLLYAGTALALLPASGALAQTSSSGEARSFQIAAQPLEEALRQFTRQSGVQVGYEPKDVTGRTSASVSDAKSAGDALSQLLAGTGLTFRYTTTNAVRLELAPQSADGSIALGPVRVEGVTGSGGGRASAVYTSATISTEGTGSYTTPVVSIAKGEQLRDIPQSISVVTRQQIEDRGIIDLTQAIAQAAGVATNIESRGGEMSFFTRGFEVNSLQVDGVATGGSYSGHYINPNLAMYDHVEVLRGVDGLFSGMGNPGGVVNLVRKRPVREAQMIGTASAGSWNNYRLELDGNLPITRDGAVRARLVGSYIDRDFFYDSATDRKKFIYGIVEADVTPTTTISVSGNYEDRFRKANYSGIPYDEAGTILRLPRNTSFVTSWAAGNFEAWEIAAGVEQRLGGDWVLKANAGHIKSTGFEEISIWGYGYESERTFYDVNLTGTFNLFGHTHKLLIGTDYSRNDWGQFYSAAKWPDDVSSDDPDFDPGQYDAPLYYWKAYDYIPTISKQRGIYGRLTLEPVKAVKLVLGGRVSWFDYESHSLGYAEDGEVLWDDETRYKERGTFTPFAGLVFDVLPDWSVYASMARIHQSQASALKGPLPGTPLDPLEGSNYEIGVKGELANGRLNISVALYRSERTGAAVVDPAYPRDWQAFGSSCCFLNSGEIVSKGIDTEVAGEILPGWQISASYTYNKNENRGDEIVPYTSDVPKHLAKLWSSYQFSGSLSRLKIGGGVSAQSGIYRDWYDWSSRTTKHAEQGGYSVWNAMAEYQFTDAVRATFNVNNLFDKTYFASVGNYGEGAWYGDPRNVMLTLRAKL